MHDPSLQILSCSNGAQLGQSGSRCFPFWGCGRRLKCPPAAIVLAQPEQLSSISASKTAIARSGIVPGTRAVPRRCDWRTFSLNPGSLTAGVVRENAVRAGAVRYPRQMPYLSPEVVLVDRELVFPVPPPTSPELELIAGEVAAHDSDSD